ncbi:ephrin type-A receptor 3-like [Diadema antillarum]|uniref:ephrin type-A receptor 3-like n=1 Tax=Diadema antillarum TaxID=105358 RepID=UPI003A8C4B3B
MPVLTNVYEWVGWYNATSGVLSRYSTCVNDIVAPAVPFSGKPVNVSVVDMHLDLDEPGKVSVTLGWSAPVQVNGQINRHVLNTFVVGQPDDKVDLTAILHQNDSQPLRATISGLSPNTAFYTEVECYVYIPSGEFGSGQAAQIFFATPDLSSLIVTSTSQTSTETSPDNFQDMTLVLTVSTVAAVVSLLIVSVVSYLAVKQFRESKSKGAHDAPIFSRHSIQRVELKEDCDDTEYLSHVYAVFRSLEVRHTRIETQTVLGKGQFGIVYRGHLRKSDGEKGEIAVAIKTVKENATRSMKQDFLNEIKLMIEIGNHPNIVAVLACCTVIEPYFAVTELVAYGDLLRFLRRCNKVEQVEKDRIYNLIDLHRYQISRQIANGMRFYHGDLAARNILVGADLVVKISDFGMASDIYQTGYQRLSTERVRPVKWASLETNKEGKCTIESDVWSYGIVLYEIFTNGGMPYEGMDGREVVRRVQDGYRMRKPESCPMDVYQNMRRCWLTNPADRPSFLSLIEEFDRKITELSKLDYLDFQSAKPNDKVDEDHHTRKVIHTGGYSSDVGESGMSATLSGESEVVDGWEFQRDDEKMSGDYCTRDRLRSYKSESECSLADFSGCVFERTADEEDETA